MTENEAKTLQSVLDSSDDLDDDFLYVPLPIALGELSHRCIIGQVIA